MALGLAMLIILGLLVDYAFRQVRIPGLVGMMLVGVVLGPCFLGLLDPALLASGADLRMVALIVILLRAGFELRKDTLRRVGTQAVLLSFVPATLEALAVMALGPRLLGLSVLESAILGTVLGAVSPAVVVPMMLDFQSRRMGTDKGIPTMVVAASSIDDVFVIVVFTSLLGLYVGGSADLAWKLAGIPVAIALGTGAGLACGWVLYRVFRRFNPRATKRLLAILGVSIVLVGLEPRIEHVVPFAALLAVMGMGAIMLAKSEHMAHEISSKLSKIWVFAQIMLFTLVGAQVDVGVAWQAGLAGSALIGLALVARCAGTWLCLLGSPLTAAERLFVVVAYLPKATVQAAIGGAPLVAMQAAGMATGPGQVILAVAVLAIVLTAAPGAWLIAFAGNRLLTQEPMLPAGDADAAPAALAEAMSVEEAMDRDVWAVRENQSLRAVLEAFAAGTFAACPVVDARGVLTGVIRMDALRPVLASEHTWETLIAADVADAPRLRTTPATRLGEAMEWMAAAGIREAFVVEADSGVLVGVLPADKARRQVEEAALEWTRSR